MFSGFVSVRMRSKTPARHISNVVKIDGLSSTTRIVLYFAIEIDLFVCKVNDKFSHPMLPGAYNLEVYDFNTVSCIVFIQSCLDDG